MPLHVHIQLACLLVSGLAAWGALALHIHREGLARLAARKEAHRYGPRT